MLQIVTLNHRQQAVIQHHATNCCISHQL